MKSWRRKIFGLEIAALAFLLLHFAVGTTSDKGFSAVTEIWYIEGQCSAEKLREIEKEYNASAQSELKKISLRSFENEAALSEAFNSQRPGLLFCSSLRAEALAERGLVVKKDDEAGLSEAVLNAVPSAKAGFFPVGSKVEVLISNKTLSKGTDLEGNFSSLEKMLEAGAAYSAEKQKPFFTATSYGDMICSLMGANGESFSGKLRDSAGNVNFRIIFNLFADCAVSGGIASLGEASGQAVEQGLIPLACVCSSELPSLDGEKIIVSPLPLPQQGKGLCQGELMGFAETAADKDASSVAENFLQWLDENESAAELAMASALLPLTDPGTPGRLVWADAMQELFSTRKQVYMEPDSSYFENESEFNLDFDKALALLQ